MITDITGIAVTKSIADPEAIIAAGAIIDTEVETDAGEGKKVTAMDNTQDNTQEAMSVEEGFARLEELLQKMEDPELPLEESFACYEEGMRLLRACNEKIDRVEKRVQVITQSGLTTDLDAE